MERFIREFVIEGAKPVATPGVKASHEQIETDTPIDPDKVSHFRGLAARCNYLSQNRPDCQFSAKEICRFMSDPTKLGVEALKRLGRYLVKTSLSVPLSLAGRGRVHGSVCGYGSRWLPPHEKVDVGRLCDAGSTRAQGVVVD